MVAVRAGIGATVLRQTKLKSHAGNRFTASWRDYMLIGSLNQQANAICGVEQKSRLASLEFLRLLWFPLRPSHYSFLAYTAHLERP